MKRFILSIDGGGMRGIYSALLLQHLETRAEKQCFELFDLIGGTSIGGILAFGLSTGITAKNMVGMFEDNIPKIFKKDWKHSCKTLWGITGSKYDPKNIDYFLDSLFGDNKIQTVLVDTLCVARDIKNAKYNILKSYKLDPVSIKEACRCTSSAPTFFPSYKLGKQLNVDGAMFMNNPSLILWTEAKKLYPYDDIYILSIGTGNFTKKYDIKNGGMKDWAIPAIEILSDSNTEGIDYIMERGVGNHLRLQIELDNPIKLDSIDTKDIDILKQCANDTYIIMKEKIDRFLGNIIIK